jgi:hypothetical protein
VSEGEQVLVTYEGRDTTGKRFRNTENNHRPGCQNCRSRSLFRLVNPA